MWVSDRRYQPNHRITLDGFFVGCPTGFIIPVFSENKNKYLQVLSSQDFVLGFRKTEDYSQNFRFRRFKENNKISIGIGDQGLFSFLSTSGRVLTGSRGYLSEEIEELIIGNKTSPLVKLDLLDFLKREDELLRAQLRRQTWKELKLKDDATRFWTNYDTSDFYSRILPDFRRYSGPVGSDIALNSSNMIDFYGALHRISASKSQDEVLILFRQYIIRWGIEKIFIKIKNNEDYIYLTNLRSDVSSNDTISDTLQKLRADIPDPADRPATFLLASQILDPEISTKDMSENLESLLRMVDMGESNCIGILPLDDDRSSGSFIVLFGREAMNENLKILHLLSHHFAHNYILHGGKLSDSSPSNFSLSNREKEVLHWMAQGKSNWTTGEILGISEHGVEFHVRNIMRKLDTDSRMACVIKALHLGLVMP